MRDKRTRRDAPLEIDPEEFRALGHRAVDRVAEYLSSVRDGKVTPGETVGQVRALLGRRGLPETGAPAADILERATDLVIRHSLYNGHPRFFGYITSSAAPLGALADFLASGVNTNVGSFTLSPVATEIEAETIRWIAELIGFPAGDGILVSGGNVANFVAFVAARRAKAGWDVRAKGFRSDESAALTLYTSAETHTWIQKAADLFGLGTEAIRWIPVDADLRMRVDVLEEKIAEDRLDGARPFLVVGTAGSVGTGAIDPLGALADLAEREGLWFHVDGAYGGVAAAMPSASEDHRALSRADSIAVDPHKWLYAPLEAGCTLVKDPKALLDAFSYRPPYYQFFDSPDEEPINFFEHGLQNSRGFRALKVWMGIQQAGREGIVRMMADDCALAKELYEAAKACDELEPFTLGLSIATFRYVPPELRTGSGPEREEILNKLNTELLNRIQTGGDAFVSNAVVNGSFVLRACIVNFRTTSADVPKTIDAVLKAGREVWRAQTAAV